MPTEPVLSKNANSFTATEAGEEEKYAESTEEVVGIPFLTICLLFTLLSVVETIS